jgi:hypothetical protein
LCSGDSLKLLASGASKYIWNTGETSQEIVVPFDMQWDLLNREDTVVSQDVEVVKKVIGTPPNFGSAL